MTFSRAFAFSVLALTLGCGAKGDDIEAPPNKDAAGIDTGDSGGACATDDGSEKIATSTVPIASMTATSSNLFWSVYDDSKPLKGIISRWSTDAIGPPIEFATRETKPMGLIGNLDALFWIEADGAAKKVERQANSATSGSKLIVPVGDDPAGFGINGDSVFAALSSGVFSYSLDGGSKSPLTDLNAKVSSAKAVAANSVYVVVLSEDTGVWSADTSGKNPQSIQDSGPTLGSVVVLDDNNAYWLEGASSSSKLRRSPLSGGTPDTLDTGVTAVTTNASAVTWAVFDDTIGGIIRTASADGSPKLVLTRKSKITNVAVGGSFVYWAESAGDTSYCIMRKSR